MIFFLFETWQAAVAFLCLCAGLIPHFATLFRPPLGQFPGVSVVINYSLCFSENFILGLLVTLGTLILWSDMGWKILWTTDGFLAVQALIVHLFNWYRYKSVFALASKNVAKVLHDLGADAAPRPVLCNDKHDELEHLRRSFISNFAFAPLLMTMMQYLGWSGIKTHRNIKYLNKGEICKDGPPCFLDIMYSEEAIKYHHFKQRPVAVYMHGGAWCFGNKFFNAGPVLRWYLAQRGFLVVSIGYRFAPSNPWPSQLECFSAALRWIHANYGRHSALPAGNSDIDKAPPTVVIGASAGAHVTLCFALIRTLLLMGAADSIPHELRHPVQLAINDDAVISSIVSFYPPTDVQDKLGLYLKFPFDVPFHLFGGTSMPRRGRSMFAWFFHRVVSQRPFVQNSIESRDDFEKEQIFIKSSSPIDLLQLLQVEVTKRLSKSTTNETQPNVPPIYPIELPPIFIVHCGGDAVVPVLASQVFFQAVGQYRKSMSRFHAKTTSKENSKERSNDGALQDMFLDVPAVGHSFDILLSKLSANASRAVYVWASSTVHAHWQESR